MNSTTIYCDNCGTANRVQAKFCFSCGQSMTITLHHIQSSVVNSVLNKRYHIIEQIGQGGMSTVYKAKDSLLGNRLVAIKEMRQIGLSLQEIADATEAFKVEALTLARLKHPSLPSIHDHFYENRRWYLVMDFLEGETLEDHLSENNHRIPSLEKILCIGEQLCLVLEYLHNQQPPIIFRDLKPANVMLTSSGHLYLIDFGIARVFKPGQARDTIALGSPGYAAPEQYGRAQTTVRSDIYSLGVMFYQMITGRDPSLSPFHFVPIQPESELTELIMQMIEIEVDKRPKDILVIKNAIQLFIKNVHILQLSVSEPSLDSNASAAKEKKPMQVPISQQFNGKGQQISPQFKLSGGLAIFHMKHDGSHHFNVVLLQKDGTRITSLVNEIGNFDGAYALGIKHSGIHLLTIKADGNWIVSVEQQISQPVKIPRTFKGRGQQISLPFMLSKGIATFHMKHDGSHHFNVVLLQKDGTRITSLVNEIGNFDGAYALGIKHSGIHLLTIKADGNWEVAISQ